MPALEKALSVLDAMVQQRAFRAAFVYASQEPEAEPSPTVEGEIAVQDEQYRLVLPGQTIICDGHTLWTHLQDANEVQVAAYDPAQSTSTPWHVLLHYREAYQVVSLRTLRASHVIVLRANDLGQPFSQVTITISQAPPQRLQRLEALDQDDVCHSFEIVDFDAEVTFEDALFQFCVEAHPGIEVIEH